MAALVWYIRAIDAEVSIRQTVCGIDWMVDRGLFCALALGEISILFYVRIKMLIKSLKLLVFQTIGFAWIVSVSLWIKAC